MKLEKEIKDKRTIKIITSDNIGKQNNTLKYPFIETGGLYMSVRNLMIKDVIYISSAASIKDVAVLMLNKSVGSVIILENHEPIGIVTEGDLVRRVIAKGKDPNQTLVKEVMTKPLITIGPNASIGDVGEIMARHGIERLPVIENGKLVGIIAEQELTEWHAKEYETVKRKLKLLSGKG